MKKNSRFEITLRDGDSAVPFNIACRETGDDGLYLEHDHRDGHRFPATRTDLLRLAADIDKLLNEA